jgi:predicted dehydrogenase
MERRDFLKIPGAAWGAAPLFGQRGKFRTALVGTGWWGMNILGEAIASGECEVVGMCDVDPNQLNPAVEKVKQLTRDEPRKYKDFRELLAKEKPAIVINATPDHWHPLVTIAACRAGAHVYVEKPIGHTIKEGRAMVKAARETGRVVQVGTHRRVSPHNISAREFIRSGKLGKIGYIRAFVLYGGGPGQKTPDSDPPPGMDWDMWCGPAPLRPFNKSIHPRGFRQHLDYANGTIADWGIHWFDQILWIMEEKYPKTVFSSGGRRIKQDSTTAPDTQTAVYRFDHFDVTWENRAYGGNAAEKHNVGCYFYGTEGMLHLGWQDGWTFYPVKKGAQVMHQEPVLHKPDSQNIKELWADFLTCIKTNRRAVCDIELGHYSTNMSLLAMVSYKTGRSLNWDGVKEVVVGDEEANRLLSRPYRKPWVYPS